MEHKELPWYRKAGKMAMHGMNVDIHRRLSHDEHLRAIHDRAEAFPATWNSASSTCRSSQPSVSSSRMAPARSATCECVCSLKPHPSYLMWPLFGCSNAWLSRVDRIDGIIRCRMQQVEASGAALLSYLPVRERL